MIHIAIFFGGSANVITPHVKQFLEYKNVIPFVSASFSQINNLNTPTLQCNIEDAPFPEYLHSVPIYAHTKPKNIYSMFYHNKKCMDLIENYEKNNNMKFDIVIKYRNDIDTSEVLNFDNPPVSDNTIYIPNNNDWGGINDQIAYGSKVAMKKYCSLIDNYQKYILEDNIINHPETILKHHLISNNLTVQRFVFSYFLNRNVEQIYQDPLVLRDSKNVNNLVLLL